MIINSKVTVNERPLGTLRMLASSDGVNWEPVYLRPIADPTAPPDAPLPEGYYWCAVHEEGKPVRFVPMLDVAALRS